MSSEPHNVESIVIFALILMLCFMLSKYSSLYQLFKTIMFVIDIWNVALIKLMGV